MVCEGLLACWFARCLHVCLFFSWLVCWFLTVSVINYDYCWLLSLVGFAFCVCGVLFVCLVGCLLVGWLVGWFVCL